MGDILTIRKHYKESKRTTGKLSENIFARPTLPKIRKMQIKTTKI